jgi:hypothetical protein
MKLTIEPCTEGCLVTCQVEDETERYALASEKDALEIAMYLLGLTGGSRHDASRLYLIEAPGDKHPDFTDAHWDVIFGRDSDS